MRYPISILPFRTRPFRIGLLAALSILPSIVASAQIPPPAVLARSWMLVDATTAQVLASHNPEERMQPASLTKLMVAYIVFDSLKDKRISMTQTMIPSDIVRKRVGEDESRMFIEPNKPVSVHDLVYGLIVQSGNDAAFALAELIGGSEPNFIAIMNRTAQKMGMVHTNFSDTNGMPDAEHYTTAGDLAILSMRLIRDFPEYYSIFSVKEFTYNRIHQFNRNRLLWIDPTVDGLKTGHTEAAGYCLIASAKRTIQTIPEKSQRLVTVMLGEKKERDRIQDSLRMLNYGYQAYTTLRLYRGGQIIDTPRIFKGTARTVKVGMLSDQLITVPRENTNKVKTTVHLINPLLAPLKKGQTVGTVSVVSDRQQMTTLKLVSLEAVPQTGFFGRLWDEIVMMVHKEIQKLFHKS